VHTLVHNTHTLVVHTNTRTHTRTHTLGSPGYTALMGHMFPIKGEQKTIHTLHTHTTHTHITHTHRSKVTHKQRTHTDKYTLHTNPHIVYMHIHVWAHKTHMHNHKLAVNISIGQYGESCLVMECELLHTHIHPLLEY